MQQLVDYVEAPDLGEPVILQGEPGAGARTIIAQLADTLSAQAQADKLVCGYKIGFLLCAC